MLIEQLRSHQFVVGLLKFFRLIFLGIISVHHIDARQIFTGYTVDVIRQFLHTADTRHDHRNDDCHHGKQRHDKAGGDNRQRPAFVDDLYDRPNRHDRRFDHNLQAHCHKHLDLRDVIRRAVDQARNRKLLHFILTEIRHLIKHLFTDCIAEACGSLRCQVSANYRKQSACERAAEHFKPCLPDVTHCAARGLDKYCQVAHIVRQAQIKIDLTQYQNGAKPGSQPLLAFHFL